jgi:hypothetical protein
MNLAIYLKHNRSKRRSTRVDHVSEVRFEIWDLDLHGFEKTLNFLLLFSLSFSFFFFFLFHLLRRAERLSNFLFFSLSEAPGASLSFYFFFFWGGPNGPPFLHVGRRCAPPESKMKGRTTLHSFFFIYIFIFIFLIFLLYSISIFFIFYLFIFLLITLN